MEMTARKLEVFRWVAGHIDHKGYAPSLAEIADYYGWKGRSRAKQMLDAFLEQGWITDADGRSRAYALTPAGRRAAK